MRKRIVITGLGVMAPEGLSVAQFWKSLLEGNSGIGNITQFDASLFDCHIAGEIKDYDPIQHFNTKEARHLERFVQFAVVAAREAVADAQLNLETEELDRIGVIVGSGIGSLQTMEREHNIFLAKGPKKMSPFLIPRLIVNEAAGQVSIDLGVKGPNTCVTTACASGTHAIGDAFRLLQHDDADVMIAGGTESCITTLGVGGFCALKALSRRSDDPKKASRPFERDRDGFVMSEGSGIVVIESLDHAKKRNARIYAEIAGYGLSGDAYHITAPDPVGHGASLAMEMAVRNSGLQPEDVDYINAHGTSTLLNDKIETLAIKNTFKEHAKKLAVSSTKSVTGHLLGAAGGVEFIACTLAIRDDVIPPTINYENPDPLCDLDYVPNAPRKQKLEVAMSNSLGFGGHNATLIIKKFTE
ncbi:beta-ketoacyl-ACP synthase II [Candidatus Omnitrophota bacterium]